jgi:hypothetical protein
VLTGGEHLARNCVTEQAEYTGRVKKQPRAQLSG